MQVASKHTKRSLASLIIKALQTETKYNAFALAKIENIDIIEYLEKV